MNNYLTQYGRVMNIRSNRNSFAQLVGEHAVRICELAKHDGSNSKRGLMETWAQIDRLNDEWANLVCNDTSKFAQVTKKLVRLYSEIMGDVILDRKVDRKKIEDIVDTEGKFFGALGNTEKKDTWFAYSGSIVDMVDALDRYGHESDAFHHSAANVIQRGILLGNWLDWSLRKSERSDRDSFCVSRGRKN